ncbi:MAG TPA: SRPBCC domain-containing protein [Puia sp.]|nr:SRPBCC domain-containing protein [Puia sp.]
MNNKSYTTTIELNKSANEVFKCLSEVPKWWSKDYRGRSTNVGDEFIIQHGDLHYSRQRLIEIVPDKKVVWLVVDSRLSWLENDKNEWTNTKMVFDVESNGDKTMIHFTHEGLAPGKECYERCEQGWNMVIKERLLNFVTAGKEI